MSNTSFQNAWTETDPDGASVPAHQIDDKMRAFRLDIGERLEEMFYGFNASDATNYEDTYGLKHLRFLSQSGITEVAFQSGTYEGFLLSSLSSAGNMDLIWKGKGADGTSAQRVLHDRFFNVDLINTNAVTDAHIRLRNNQWLTSRNAADDGDVNVIKITTEDKAALTMGTILNSTTQDAADGSIACKKYVDDTVAAAVAATHATSSKNTSGYLRLGDAAGDLILQWGETTLTGVSNAVTFPLEFPTACYQVVVCGGKAATSSAYDTMASNLSTTGFTIRCGSTAHAEASTPGRWFAIGK